MINNLTNSFHVAVNLFRNRSQMNSKCGKNKKEANQVQPSLSLIFLPHLKFLYYMLYVIKKQDFVAVVTSSM